MNQTFFLVEPPVQLNFKRKTHKKQFLHFRYRFCFAYSKGGVGEVLHNTHWKIRYEMLPYGDKTMIKRSRFFPTHQGHLQHDLGHLEQLRCLCDCHLNIVQIVYVIS